MLTKARLPQWRWPGDGVVSDLAACSAILSPSYFDPDISFPYSHFENIIELVLTRCKQLPRQYLIMFWHHCLLEAFHYLDLQRN